MKLLLLSVLSAGALVAGQDVTGVSQAQQLAITASAAALTITASQGDGTKCTASKVAGGAITLSLTCTSGDGKTSSATLLRSGGNTSAMPFGYGDVTCLFGFNPGATAVTMGSLGSVPAIGVAWACSTNIRVSGTVTAQTAIVAGTVTWP